MIASLGMYDFPWLREANDALWTAIGGRLRSDGIDDAPVRLTRGVDLDDIWRSPALLLGQTCGYPLMTELRESVQVVATPLHDAPGCDGASHRAAIVVRAGDAAASLADLRGRRVAINSRRSNTGMNLLRAQIAPIARGDAFFGDAIITGSHARSLSAVLSGRADVASIDAVTLAHLQARYPRHADAVRVLAWTAPSPALPLITGADTPATTVESLRQALQAIAEDASMRAVLASLLIRDFVVSPIEAYAPVLAFEEDARRLDYPILA